MKPFPLFLHSTAKDSVYPQLADTLYPSTLFEAGKEGMVNKYLVAHLRHAFPLRAGNAADHAEEARASASHHVANHYHMDEFGPLRSIGILVRDLADVKFDETPATEALHNFPTNRRATLLQNDAKQHKPPVFRPFFNRQMWQKKYKGFATVADRRKPNREMKSSEPRQSPSTLQIIE